MSRKALVTGGAGFIGNRLVDALLEQGYGVVVLDNLKRGNKLSPESLRRAEFIEGDIRDAATVDRAVSGCDLVFHLAAVLGVDIVADNPVETMHTETIGLINVTSACMRHAVRNLVYASTSGVYGKAAIEQAVDEEFDVMPNSSYSIAKRYNEIYLKSLWQEKRLPSVAIRFFNVYGPKQDDRMVIPRFIQQALEGRPLTVYGSGLQTRDFTYIDDVVEATVLLGENCRSCEIVNVSHSHEITIGELARRIKALTRTSSEIQLINMPTGRYDLEVNRRVGDSSKLHRLIGHRPTTDLDTGLKRTLAYFLEHAGR